MRVILRKSATFLRLLLAGLTGWGILVPISHLFPKKKKRIIVIGQSGERFLDNTKYLFLHLVELGADCLYLAGSNKIAAELREKRLPAIPGFSPRAILCLFSAHTVVVDGFELRFGMRFYLTHGARKVQLWHGFPIKKINLQRRFPAPRNLKARLGKAFWSFAGYFPLYDILVSTSTFCTRSALVGAFRTRKIIETGYPRNDVLFATPTPVNLLGTEPDKMGILREKKAKGTKLALYAPTFRDHGGNAVEDGALDLSSLDRFAREHNLLLMIKVHVNEPDLSGVENLKNIINYPATADIYPFLNIFDLMITDYSSMFFDFLLLNKPIIFFPYDYETYIVLDRPLLFEYRGAMTPGPICFTQNELEKELTRILEGRDSHQGARIETKKLAFDYDDDRAAERIAQAILPK